METLTIKVKNKERLPFLYEMLRYFDFIELQNVSIEQPQRKEHDFFMSAGLWKNRDITQELLRRKAWKRDT